MSLRIPSIDPVVADEIIKTKNPSLGRIVLAACLCREILSEKKLWNSPRDMVHAEKMAQQCGRSPSQIKQAILEWFTIDSDPKNLAEKMRMIFSWDPMLAGWIVFQMLAERSAEETPAPSCVQDMVRDFRASFFNVSSSSRRGERSLSEFTFFVLREQEMNAFPYYPPEWKSPEGRRETCKIGQVQELIFGHMNAIGVAIFAPKGNRRERIGFDLAYEAAATRQFRRKDTTNIDVFGMFERGLMSYPRSYEGGPRARSSGVVDGASSLMIPAAIGVIAGSAMMHWKQTRRS